jgi:hypothetical protein
VLSIETLGIYFYFVLIQCNLHAIIKLDGTRVKLGCEIRCEAWRVFRLSSFEIEAKIIFFDRVRNSFLEEIFLIFARIVNRLLSYKYGRILDINQLNEFTIKLRHRH